MDEGDPDPNRLVTRSGERAVLVIATRNRHKAEEIQSIIEDGFECHTLNDFPGAPAVVEDAATFAGNATKKAVELANWIGERVSSFEFQVPSPNGTQEWCVLADDSGLDVDALGGAPGVHSARFAALDQIGEPGANSTDAANNSKLLRLLEDVPLEKRTARFRCVLALAPIVSPEPVRRSPVCYAEEADLRIQLFEGVCEGRISFAPSGTGGFGYDPLFVPLGYQQSFAELGEDVKNRISHRARALNKLRGACGVRRET